MKLVILAEGGFNHEVENITTDAEITTVNMLKLLDNPDMFKEDILKLKKLYIVGFDVENITGAIFGMMENPEAIAHLLGIDGSELPKFDIILSREIPTLETGDIVATPIIGGNVAIVRVNYKPKYNLERLINNSMLFSYQINEACTLVTDKGEFKFKPSSEHPETGWLFLPNIDRPVLVQGRNARLYGTSNYIHGLVTTIMHAAIDDKKKKMPPGLGDMDDKKRLEIAAIANTADAPLKGIDKEVKALIKSSRELKWPYNNEYWRGVRRGLLLDIRDTLKKHKLV